VTLGDFLKMEISLSHNGLLRASSNRRKLYRLLGRLLLPLFLSSPIVAQKATPGRDTERTTKTVESPIKYDGILYVPGDRRDPFLNPKHYRKPAPPGDEEITRGLPPPGIAGTYIAQATLEGVSIGNDRRVATVRGADSRAYFLKEGDRLFDGYLKSIQEDFIILVRETKMRSGKTMTQDVTKRLRTP
jgi:hypothetical protein